MSEICVFCRNQKQEPLQLFTSDTLNKCNMILTIRVKYELCYNDVSLPTSAEKGECYHLRCYRKFTALSKKYREKLIRDTITDTVFVEMGMAESMRMAESISTAIRPTFIDDGPKTVEIEETLAFHARTYKRFNSLNDSLKITIKNVDGSSMPPCESELHKQFLRSIYITTIWRNAHCKILTHLSPTDYGWKIIDDCYEFDWFESDQLPQMISDVVIQPPKENSDYQSESESEALVSSDNESDAEIFYESEDEWA